MTASLSEALTAIETALVDVFPAGVSVRRVGGPFDAAEIRRHVTAAPAVLIACIDLDGYARVADGTWRADADFVAYVLTRDTPSAPRDLMALDLVTTLLAQIPYATWGDPAAFDPADQDTLQAANLYGGDIDSVAVALWSVAWSQGVTLP